MKKKEEGQFGIFSGGGGESLANRDLDKYKLGRKLKKNQVELRIGKKLEREGEETVWMGEVGEAVKRMESVSHSLSHTLPTHFTDWKTTSPHQKLSCTL